MSKGIGGEMRQTQYGHRRTVQANLRVRVRNPVSRRPEEDGLHRGEEGGGGSVEESCEPTGS